MQSAPDSIRLAARHTLEIHSTMIFHFAYNVRKEYQGNIWKVIVFT